jgi:hypothetical protein
MALMGEVFEDVLKILGLSDREDPSTTLIAHKIIELVQSVEHDPARIQQLTLEALKEPGVFEAPNHPLSDETQTGNYLIKSPNPSVPRKRSPIKPRSPLTTQIAKQETKEGIHT